MSEILALLLLFSAALLTGITSIVTTAKAQTIVGEHLTAALKNINDQIELPPKPPPPASPLAAKLPPPAAPPPPPAAIACWFPSMGSETNSDANAMTKMLNVIIVFV